MEEEGGFDAGRRADPMTAVPQLLEEKQAAGGASQTDSGHEGHAGAPASQASRTSARPSREGTRRRRTPPCPAAPTQPEASGRPSRSRHPDAETSGCGRGERLAGRSAGGEGERPRAGGRGAPGAAQRNGSHLPKSSTPWKLPRGGSRSSSG